MAMSNFSRPTKFKPSDHHPQKRTDEMSLTPPNSSAAAADDDDDDDYDEFVWKYVCSRMLNLICDSSYSFGARTRTLSPVS